MTSVVKDNENYDYLSDCFTDLQEDYTINLEIITEYKKTLDSFRKGKHGKNTNFFKKKNFIVKV